MSHYRFNSLGRLIQKILSYKYLAHNSDCPPPQKWEYAFVDRFRVSRLRGAGCTPACECGDVRCFKELVRTLRNVCGEQPRLRPAPKLRTTRKTKPSISGLPIRGGLW